MVIKIDGREFDGLIGSKSETQLELVINTDTDFGVISNLLTTLEKIETIDANGIISTTYTNVAPISLTRVGNHTFVIICAIKKDEIGELKSQVDDLNSAIDSLLVVMLEGDET